jgi:hypothetical protein
MVIGKLKYLIEPGRGTYHPTVLMSFPWAHGKCKSSHDPALFHGSWTYVLEDGGPVP